MKLIGSAGQLLLAFISALHPYLLPFLLGGLLLRNRTRDRRGELYLATVMVTYLLLLWLFLSTHHYISKRHLLPVILLILIWCSGGISEISQSLEKLRPSWPSRYFTIFLLILTLGVMLPKDLKPIRAGHELRRQIGLWLRERGIKHPIIISREPRFAFYARGQGIPLTTYDYGQIMRLARRTGAHYLIINTGDLGDRLGIFLRSIDPKQLAILPIDGLDTEEPDGDKWLVFRFLNNR